MKKNKNIKWFIVLGIIVAVIIALVATCPNEDDHQEALAKQVKTAVNQKMQEELGNGLAVLGSVFTDAAVNMALNSNITVDDYGIFSLGKMTWDGKSKIVSVGVLNHVYTASKEDIKQQLDKGLKDVLPEK